METPDNLQEAMSMAAREWVELCQSANVRLDYSIDSVRVVEQQLARLHDQIPRGLVARFTKARPPDAEIHRMAMRSGAYVAEVLRRNIGGEWTTQSEAFPGKDVLTFRHPGGLELWPHVKTEKRIREGGAENVWAYIQALLGQIGPAAAPPAGA